MVALEIPTSVPQPTRPQWITRKASDYSYDDLAEIFNATRIDYIVPMPMNGRRMKDYIRDYDVDLSHSLVITDGNAEPAGMGMIAFREHRAWLTRLGVVPHLRQHKLGHLLMDGLIERAYEHKSKQIQLEVIVGNEPAKRLFLRHGFDCERVLAILNRPPTPIAVPDQAEYAVSEISGAALEMCLAEPRLSPPSWLDESASLIKSDQICGFRALHRDGSCGWVVFRRARFQLTHFATNIPPAHTQPMLIALFAHIHRTYPNFDAKMENFPAEDPGMDALKAVGYFEVFRRTEMYRVLT